MNGAAFVSLNDQVVKLRQEISTQNQYKKKSRQARGRKENRTQEERKRKTGKKQRQA